MQRDRFDQTVAWIIAVFISASIFVGIAALILFVLPKQETKIEPVEATPVPLPSETDADSIPWNYAGSKGPKHWASMSPSFALCLQGEQQSPINIYDAKESKKLSGLKFHYSKSDITLHNNGRLLYAKAPESGYFELNHKKHSLKSIYFHAPSEHKIDGGFYDMEIQLYHEDQEGHLTAIAILLEEGEPNEALYPIWQKFPEEPDTHSEAFSFDVTTILPKNYSYFKYVGSLTTPPCTENVNWVVLATPIKISGNAIDSFTNIVRFSARPTQSRHGRKILKKP